jgi:cell pole-organizing protein PopZ
MVLDLLKPMLRQWLDQNMSRLVAEALSEEVQRTRTPEGGAKKT